MQDGEQTTAPGGSVKGQQLLEQKRQELETQRKAEEQLLHEAEMRRQLSSTGSGNTPPPLPAEPPPMESPPPGAQRYVPTTQVLASQPISLVCIL